jgi:hypothetical protein
MLRTARHTRLRRMQTVKLFTSADMLYHSYKLLLQFDRRLRRSAFWPGYGVTYPRGFALQTLFSASPGSRRARPAAAWLYYTTNAPQSGKNADKFRIFFEFGSQFVCFAAINPGYL